MGRKCLILFLTATIYIAPAAAATVKTDAPSVYFGASVGYDGARDSLAAMIGKLFGIIFTGGIADPEESGLEPVFENSLSFGADIYWETSKSFSLALSGGCGIAFQTGKTIPSPYGNLIGYWRFPGGSHGDFLLGCGVGTYALVDEAGISGFLAPLGALRYQLDITPHTGWWIDLALGPVLMGYGNSGVSFISSNLLIMNSVRTGISYSL